MTKTIMPPPSIGEALSNAVVIHLCVPCPQLKSSAL